MLITHYEGRRSKWHHYRADQKISQSQRQEEVIGGALEVPSEYN